MDAFSTKESFSGSQGRVLHFLLAQTEDVFKKTLKKNTVFAHLQQTALLKKMEENGLIFRESLPNDGRMKKIVVTEKALQYKDIVMSDITQLEDELTTDISESDMDIFF